MGVAFMGVAQGLGVPLPATAGAIVVGAFFGDKISPLSDSPVLVSSVTEVPLMEGIKHALLSTGPAYLVSLVFLRIYGLQMCIRDRERSYRREPEKLQPVIDVRYRRYPHFCETMRRRAETYNASRERLFQLEREGVVYWLSLIHI